MKSDIEIAKFVYHKIKGTELERNVSGKLSDRGRPNKSDKYILTNKGIKNDCFINWNTYICNVISFDMKI